MNLQHENERFFRRLNRSSSTSDINKNGLSAVVFKMVGMTGFEPATPSSRTKCTTKLCYIPMHQLFYHFTAEMQEKNEKISSFREKKKNRGFRS